MKEAHIDSLHVRIAGAIYLLGDEKEPTQRPNAEVVELFHCEGDGVVMLWPKGCTLRQAILAWAKAQPENVPS